MALPVPHYKENYTNKCYTETEARRITAQTILKSRRDELHWERRFTAAGNRPGVIVIVIVIVTITFFTVIVIVMVNLILIVIVIVIVIAEKVIVIHYYFAITFCQTHTTFCQICHWSVKSHCHLIGCWIKLSFVILFIIDSVAEKPHHLKQTKHVYLTESKLITMGSQLRIYIWHPWLVNVCITCATVLIQGP